MKSKKVNLKLNDNDIVNIDCISISYEKNIILENISFSVQAGEFFIIVGPNGSGKTTLMKTIAGLVTFQTGQIFIYQKSIKNYNYKKLASVVGFVSQNFFTDFPIKVIDSVMLGRTPHMGILGIANKKDIETVNQAMEFTEISHLANRNLDQLSMGELQRVSIARAICQDTNIILLDEPTASLDIKHQILIMDLMEELRIKKKITIIMISHDINLAAMYANRLLLLKNGKIIQIGPPNQVITYKTIKNTYDCTILIDENKLCKCPRVLPVPKKFH